MHGKSPRPASPARRTFYGWYVTYALMVISTMTAGFLFYNVSVLLEAFVAERGFPIGLASFATGIFFVTSGIAGLIVGQIINRIDARKIIIASACVTALALASVGLLRTPAQLVAFYVVLGFCYGGCGLVTASTIVARWFDAKRPQALSIASTGLSLGGIIITPFVAYIIKTYGLAAAGPWLGASFFLGVVPVTFLIVRASPLDMGLRPDGAEAMPGIAGVAPLSGVSFSKAWKSRFFVAVTLAYVFSLGAQVGAIAHLFRLAVTRADAQFAAAVVALLASASLIGRLIGGQLLAKIPARAFTLALMANQAVALAFLAFAVTKVALLAGVALFGFTIGNILMMQQLLLAEAFGSREYGRIYSASQLVTVIGVATWPALIGFIFVASGGYEWPYLVTALSTLIGATILSLSGPSKH
ncbi:MAG TPA: MFS transporter [Xanthobacteraceae bacterium]|nr:MFS transporter [Xanthobacteraceae bacterium]